MGMLDKNIRDAKKIKDALNMFGLKAKGPERTEKTNIKLELDYDAHKKHHAAVELLIPKFDTQVLPGDTLKIDYDFLIEYFDNVSVKLQAVQELCEDPDVVVDASCNRLQRGSCVIFDALKALENIIKQVKAREE